MESKGTQYGFTILELVIVIIVLAIVAIAIIPRWPSARLEVNAAANQVVSDVRYTQTLAMSLNDHYEFHFVHTAGLDSYYIKNATTGTKVDHPVLASSSGNKTDVYLDKTIEFTGSGCVGFNGRGTPVACTGTQDTPNPNLEITLQKSKASKTITVTSETGYIATS